MKKLELKSKYADLVDYVFWFSFILFTNPGGLLAALGENSADGGINITDLLWVVMIGCFIIVHRKDETSNDLSYKKIVRYLFIFLIYYFLVFVIIVPILKNNANNSMLFTLIKTRHSVIHISLFFIVYKFYLRSYPIFWKLFLISSLAILTTFFISIIVGVDIFPKKTWERRFIDIQRIILTNYGLMPLLIYLGTVVFIFKYKTNFRNYFLVGFGFMYTAWLLSLFRRHIFGTFIIIFVALMLHNYLLKKALIPIKKVFSIAFYFIIIIVAIKFTFPSYIDAGIAAGEETILVVRTGKTSMGKEDPRLGAGREFLQNLISDNYIVGTGFDNRWRTFEGNLAGYEASDYPFLGAIAMYGIFGLIFFLPIYIVLFKAMRFDIKYFRYNGYDVYSFESFVLMVFIIYFIYDLMQYMNWFLPLSVIMDPKWYIFLAMYLASRKIFYDNENLQMKINAELKKKIC